MILQFCLTALFLEHRRDGHDTPRVSVLQAQHLVLQSLGRLLLMGLETGLLRMLLTTIPHQTLSKQPALMACQPLHQTQA